ncbi:sensor domain-containing protein [Streptomyces albus]|nr:sensor domain-containing protein [Streptomyces albus]
MPRPAVREALRRPSRFLLSAWPLRCWLHLLGGVLSGAVVLAVLVVAVSLGVVLSVIGVGLLILVAVPLLGLPVAAVERRRLRLVEPARLPAPHGPPAAGGRGGGCATGSGACHLARTRVRRALLDRLHLRRARRTRADRPRGDPGPDPRGGLGTRPGDRHGDPGRGRREPLAALPFTALGAAGLVLAAYAAGWLTTAQVRTAWFLLAPATTG